VATITEARRALEYKRCKSDLVYFLETYWKIKTVSVGYGKFNMYDYQVEDARKFQELCEYADKRLANPSWKPTPAERRRLRQIRLKARQLGWTTLGAGATFWSAFFYDAHPWLLLAQGQDDANKTVSVMLKPPMQMLPKWLRDMGPEVIRETTEEIEFENGSSITSLPSTSSSGRGRAAFGTMLDENAFMADPDDVFAAVEPLTYGPLFVWSTANGMGNFFHETWLDSQLGDSEWEGTFHPWDARPGRDQEWYDMTLRRYRGREHLFYQEYPSTPEEAFSKSGNTALPMDILRDEMDWRIPEHRYDLQVMRGLWMDAPMDTDMDSLAELAEVTEGDPDFELRVWDEPWVERDEMGRVVQSPNYVVGVDVSEGLAHGDYSAISVKNANNGETVATMLAHVPVHDLADYVEMLGYWYFTALVGVERNNHGLLPLAQLQERGYPRLYRMESIAQIKAGDRTPRYGWHTNRATKPLMVNDFNRAIIHGETFLHDDRLFHEAQTFLSDGKGGYGASYPNHDDLVIAEMIAYQMEKDVGKFPIAWFDPLPQHVTIGQVLGLSDPDPSDGLAMAGGIGQKEATSAKSHKSFPMLQLGT